MGVWIETEIKHIIMYDFRVTPCMGVWIETEKYILFNIRIKSHPVWVCGLKLITGRKSSFAQCVTPCMGVWIETLIEISV